MSKQISTIAKNIKKKISNVLGVSVDDLIK
jgi:hypothetical protein